ncbi:hypothetical protein M3Y98_00429300 [Aphelenchoides besseyi]|nr:hypothetical protein M3Y98_00429300 [Aphelenchoides besseyi]
MGASQSTTVAGEGTTTKTIYIDENELPEAYRRVGVSDEVIDAVSRATQRGPAKIVFDADPSPSKLSNDLLKERQENQRLRDELKRLSHLQSRIVVAPAPKPAPVQAPIQPPSPPPVQLQERFIPPQKDGNQP